MCDFLKSLRCVYIWVSWECLGVSESSLDALGTSINPVTVWDSKSFSWCRLLSWYSNWQITYYSSSIYTDKDISIYLGEHMVVEWNIWLQNGIYNKNTHTPKDAEGCWLKSSQVLVATETHDLENCVRDMIGLRHGTCVEHGGALVVLW